MATVAISLCEDAGCKQHVTFTITDGANTESFIRTRDEIIAELNNQDARYDTILHNAMTYGRKRKGESATWAEIITEIEVKEFSI